MNNRKKEYLRAYYVKHKQKINKRRQKIRPSRAKNPVVSKAARFWRQVEVQDTGCWNWITKHKRIRPAFPLNNRIMNTQRAAWILTHGPITSNLWVLHKCNNASCCRPDHLYLGTHKQNMEDRDNAQRTAKRARHGMAKLTEDQVALIRSSNQGSRELAAILGIARNYVSSIRKGKRWKEATTPPSPPKSPTQAP
jgi:DNA-binding CsgD family transcriptional regulator